jgi:uncharacterized membrane protein YeaQ/YmgE (transglycosylase-associated protein family)
MNFDPGGVLAWLVVGAIAGWLAGSFMRGAGFGLLGNVVVGIVGGLLGGLVLGQLGIAGTTGLLGSIVVAFLGAVLLLAVANALAPGRPSV